MMLPLAEPSFQAAVGVGTSAIGLLAPLHTCLDDRQPPGSPGRIMSWETLGDDQHSSLMKHRSS